MSQDVTATFGYSKQQLVAVPNFGLKFKFNHKFPEKENFSQNLRPSWKQCWDLVPMMFRYVPYYYRNSRSGHPILMDYFSMNNSLGIYGCPLGGIGTGKLTFKVFVFTLYRFTFVIRLDWKGICRRILPIPNEAGNLRVQHCSRKSVHYKHPR